MTVLWRWYFGGGGAAPNCSVLFGFARLVVFMATVELGRWELGESELKCHGALCSESSQFFILHAHAPWIVSSLRLISGILKKVNFDSFCQYSFRSGFLVILTVPYWKLLLNMRILYTT